MIQYYNQNNLEQRCLSTTYIDLLTTMNVMSLLNLVMHTGISFSQAHSYKGVVLYVSVFVTRVIQNSRDEIYQLVEAANWALQLSRV